ncbi:sensor histidine kinase [Nocardioides sp. GXZ039]|uniref:sensor histidine kinase n=1 Tax=Nocardioides sp. GXZ039 TaxID=3136018 RepID=UPI0030F435FE
MGSQPRTGIRVRTTVVAVLIVAIALLAGATALVLLVRESLVDAAQNSAETRAESTAAQIEASGPPRPVGGQRGDEDDDPDVEDTLVEVAAEDGEVIDTNAPGLRLAATVGDDDADDVRLDGDWADATFVVRQERATWEGETYLVTVAVSREDVDDTTAALLPPLAVGIPLLLVVVGAATWLVVGRALAPVERIRSEVAEITDDRLDLRVPEPGSGDEIGRLAGTMNQMLDRLERSRAQQQRFVSDASHELRSPIATLRQSAEVAHGHPDAFEPGEFAETVTHEATRMQRLVEQLLVLTRTDEGRIGTPEEIDVDDLVLAEATRLRRAGLEVDSSGVQAVRMHASRIAWAQIVRNLADNAQRHAASAVTLRLALVGPECVLIVDDDGAGVPAGERERIFDRFVRLDEARARDDGGSGLGLAIVRDLARAHGGSVRVEESPAGGARFVVTMPA